MTTATAPGLKQVHLVLVHTPNGGTIEVMGQAEADRYGQALAAYTTGVSFTERSDLEDLERILFMELMCYRWGRWLMAGQEYDGTLITNEGELRRWINDYATQITKVKESLKLDRKGRESDQAATFHERWTQLAQHAKDFGIMREAQLGKALEIMQDTYAILGAYDRSDDEERRVLGFPTADHILQHLRESRPEFDEVDAYFRTHQQRFWVRQP